MKNYQNPVGSVHLDLTKLEAIERQLGKKFYVKVGILGQKSHNRKEVVETKSGKRKAGKSRADMTNAEVGFQNEYGVASKNIPERSFLRFPLWFKLPRVLNQVGQSVINGLTKTNIRDAYKGLGIIAERIIQGAFKTRGYGKWAPNAELTKMIKKSDSPLIDTGQLRRSVTSKVESQ